MTIATLPTRNPADLGAALYDARTPNANELAAVNVEKIKDRLIEVATEIGLSSGATAGSINAMRFAFETGGYDAILRRIGSTYGSQRVGGGFSAPTVGDDSADGYAPGSWWVQGTSSEDPTTLAFFVCIDATGGAAVWIQIKAGADPSDADPLAPGVADPGTSPDFARADHVHPGELPELIETFDFSRATEASYYCPPRPPAYHPGGKTVLAWAPIDALRHTETGLVVIERSPSYAPAASRTFTGWVGASAGATVTAGYADGPDGVASVAARVLAPGNEYGPYSTTGAGPNAASVWVRRLDGAYAGRMQGAFGGGGSLTVEIATDKPEQWTRVDTISPVTTSDVWLPFDSRATTSPMIATPQDLICDLHSIEVGARYATSSTRTNARGQDVFSLDAEDVPQTIRSGRSLVDIELEWSSSAIISGNLRTLYSFGGISDGLRIRHNGTDVRLEAHVAGSVVATSGALTWTGAFLLPAKMSVEVDPSAGTISVDGVVTTGTPWTWPTSAFRLGGVWGGALELDGAISIPRGIASARGSRDAGAPVLPLLSGTVKIMVAGNSEVDGGGFAGDGNSCRKWLVDSFAADSITINMVGPNATGSFSDNQHAGVGGTTLAAMNGSIGAWLTTYTPDVVVIWAGLNDANASTPAATIATHWGTLLATMYAALPGCRVVCCLIPHNGSGTAIDAIIRAANALLPAVFAASSYGAAGRLVTANIEGCIPTRSPRDVVDSIPHPTRKSFKRVARALYPRILNAMGRDADWSL